MEKQYQIAVVGPAGPEEYPADSPPHPSVYERSFVVGRRLAEAGCIVVTGGKSGIMSESARGAKTIAGAVTVGVVKGADRFTSNPYIDVEVVSGAAANGLDEYQIVAMTDGLIILGGGAGTLQEMVLAYRNQKPMVVLEGCDGWGEKLAGTDLDPRKTIAIERAQSPDQAVEYLLRAIAHHRNDHSS